MAQNRMKQYADANRTEREFAVGDWVYLRIKLYKQVTAAQFQYCKLSPKNYGPFQVLQRAGPVAYKLQLPPEARIHSECHVSVLKKKVGKTDQVSQQLPSVDVHGQFIVEPLSILERRMVKKGNAAAVEVLVQWSNTLPSDATWESWDDLHKQFPHFQP